MLLPEVQVGFIRGLELAISHTSETRGCVGHTAGAQDPIIFKVRYGAAEARLDTGVARIEIIHEPRFTIHDTSSSSIFLAGPSSPAMRKLRIVLRAPPPGGLSAGRRFPSSAPPASSSATTHPPWRMRPLPPQWPLRGKSPEFPRPVQPASAPRISRMRPVTGSPALCSAMYSSRLLGTSCFMLRRTALLAVDVHHLGAHDLARLQNILRMIDALLRADFADVNHAFDAFGKLHERAELGDAGDRTFDHRADREPLPDSAQGSPSACFSPSEMRRSPGFTPSTTASTVSPGLTTSQGLRTFSATTFRKDESGLRFRARVPRRRRSRSIA